MDISPNEPVRIAVIQITSHPFVTVNTTDFASEPFSPSDPKETGCLGRLVNQKVEVTGLRKDIREEYEKWHWGRLSASITWLFSEERNWPNAKPPELIILPEFSHSWKHVTRLQSLAKQFKVAICAGSHGFETRARFAEYDGGYLDSEKLKHFDSISRGSKSVIVEIDAFGKIFSRLKWRLSPFEQTDARTPYTDDDRPQVRELALRNQREIRILTLVCSEALQHLPTNFIPSDLLGSETRNSGRPPIDIVAIPSYDFNPKSFKPILEHYSRNRVPVIYCNDGIAGGSCVQIIPDPRKGIWFWNPPLNGHLPKGDGIFVSDIVPHAATDHHAANPRETYSLVKLASIVPADPFNGPTVVARQLNVLKANRRQSFNDGSQLIALLDSAHPDILQEHKVHHLIAQYGLSDSLDWWDILADDCVVKGMTSNSGDEVTLQRLEELFARTCYDWIRSELDGENRRPELGSELLAVRDICRKRFSKHQPDDPLGAIKAFNASTAKDNKDRTMLELHELLGILVERFRATSGWIFLVEQPDRLVARVSHNSPIATVLTQAINGPDSVSIVKHVYNSRRGYITNDVDADRFYQRVLETTQSEICVPIFAPIHSAGEEVIAILNLESRNSDAFLPCHVGELQSAVSRFAVGLLLLREHFAIKGFCQWHPGKHGWSVRHVINGFCRTVATSVLPSHVQEALSCTVWYHDSTKEVLFVIGTARFDFEYVNLRLLPETSWTGGVALAGKKRKSKPVTLAEAKRRGSRTPDLSGDRYEFFRSAKAERMEVALINSVPVNSSLTERSASVMGVLSLYFFERERQIYGDVVVNQFNDPIIGRISQHLQRLFDGIVTLRVSVANASLRAILTENSIPTVTDLVSTRRFLAECFEADGCSVFGVVRTPGSPRIVPLSTTGLKGSVSADGKDAYYELNNPDTSKGFTAYLGKNVGSTYRRHDVADPDEIVLANQPKLPANQYPEDFAPTDRDHRRFLGASYGEADLLSGIVRVVRKPSDPFFLSEDETLLQQLGLSLVPLLQCSSREISETSSHSIADELRIILQQAVSTITPRMDQLIQSLCSYRSGPFGWNRKLVDAVLQTAIALADEVTGRTVVLANIRILYPISELRGRGVQNPQALRLYAFHSKFSGQPPDEDEEAPLIAKNLGRAAIEIGIPFYFIKAKCGRLFNVIHRDSKKVISGVNFPFRYTSDVSGEEAAAGVITCVLSLDASKELSEIEQKCIISIANVVENILHFLGNDNSKPSQKGLSEGDAGNFINAPRALTAEERALYFNEEVSLDAITLWPLLATASTT